jgi:hypothetical protein
MIPFRFSFPGDLRVRFVRLHVEKNVIHVGPRNCGVSLRGVGLVLSVLQSEPKVIAFGLNCRDLGPKPDYSTIVRLARTS